MAGMVQPDAILPLWMETEVPEARRTEEDASAASLGVIVMVPRSVFAPPTSAAAGEMVLVERPRQEGSSVCGAGAEPPHTLIWMGTDMSWLEWAES
jgi:hypothetical protein